MQDARSVVTRVEFRIDATRENAERIPLGYIVEAWRENTRWMGMIYRPELTPNERKHVNSDTWPELSDPKQLLDELFDAAWAARDGSAGDTLQGRFGPMSALHAFIAEPESQFAVGLVDFSDAETSQALVQRLHRYESLLRPVCNATILNFLRPAHAKLKTYSAPRHGEYEPVAAVA